MADVVVHKRQAVIDRLKRRMEGYRRHNQDCVPRYSNAFVEQQNVQETLMLKQKYMETKTKRNVKKNDKKPMENGTMPPKFGTKRPSSEDMDGSDGIYHDGMPAPPKCVPIPPCGGNNGGGGGPQQQQSPHAKNDASNNAKFSVKIVQELEFSTSEHQHNAQISTNLTLTSVNTSVQSDVTTKQSAGGPGPGAGGTVPSASGAGGVPPGAAAATAGGAPAGGVAGTDRPLHECKQEQPDLMDFPGDGDLNDLSFINNDTNEPMLAVDTDTLTEIISDLNSEGITPADFNQVDLCDKRPIKTEPDARCTPPVKSPYDQHQQQQQQHQPQPPQRGGVVGSANGNNNYSNCVAAETLKQLAEQHNNQQQRPDKCGYDFPYQSPGSVPDFIHSPSTPVGTPNPNGYNMMSPVNSMYHQQQQQQQQDNKQENNNYYHPQEPPKSRMKQQQQPPPPPPPQQQQQQQQQPTVAAQRQQKQQQLPPPQQQQQQQQQQPLQSPQARYNQYNGHGSPQYPVSVARRITPSPGAASAGVLSPQQPNAASPADVVTSFQMSQSQQVHVSQQGQQVFGGGGSGGQGPAAAIQERLMTGTSVTSSAPPTCGGGGPMQQYYNSNCGGGADNGQQQSSYMHMSQSQGMTFSQQRARLHSAGASPTNIRPPTNVVQQQQQQPTINNEHHNMLPQHMNRTTANQMNMNMGGGPGVGGGGGGCRPPPPEYKLNVAQNMGMCQTQFPAQGYMPPARQSLPQGAQSRRPIQQQPIPPSGPMLRSQMANTGGGGSIPSGYDRNMSSVQRNMMYQGSGNLQRPPNVTPSSEAFNSDWQQLLAARQQQQQQQQQQHQQQQQPPPQHQHQQQPQPHQHQQQPQPHQHQQQSQPHQFRATLNQASMSNINQAANNPVNNIGAGYGGGNPNMNACQTGPNNVHLMAGQMQHMSTRMGNAQQTITQQQHANINMQSQSNQMSVNLQMSQSMNVKMGGGGPSRMAANNAQMVPQQQQQQQPQQQQHPQHHHQQQQPSPQQHPSMMRAQQQQSFTQQQATMNTGSPYQRNMASGYGANQHVQQYQQTNAAMQPVTVANPTTMINTNNGGLPPRNTFSPSDFNFDFLDQPLANDNKNGFNNKQQTFGDFNFDFLDAH